MLNNGNNNDYWNTIENMNLNTMYKPYGTFEQDAIENFSRKIENDLIRLSSLFGANTNK